MDDFDLLVSQEISYNLKTIENRCKQILEGLIDKNVYDVYQPKEYIRTYQLRNNIKTKIENEILYLYINTGNMSYNDFYGNNVTKYVPYWINYGHNSKNYKKFMLFQYPNRNFIEEAKTQIENEFGFEVEIMNSVELL